MFELLENPFFQRALAAAALVGFTNGFFSGFVILRRTALSVSALSHTMLPGIAVAIFITGALTQLNAFLGALIAALMVGLGSVAVARGNRVAQGTALAVLYTSAFAGGVALLPHLGVRQELEHWLFGDINAVSNTDLWTVFGIVVFGIWTECLSVMVVVVCYMVFRVCIQGCARSRPYISWCAGRTECGGGDTEEGPCTLSLILIF